MRAFKYITLLALGILALPTVATVPAAPSTPSHVGTLKATDSQGSRWARCDDAYFQYLPGPVDFCLGLHDWQRGHYGEGLEFLKLAAGWGSKPAQLTLGLIYYNGHHVAPNRALGIAWLKLANERHNTAEIRRVTLSAIKWASPQELQRSNQLLDKMAPRYGDAVAAKRAWTQYLHWTTHEYIVLNGALGNSGSDPCIYLPTAAPAFPSAQSVSNAAPITPNMPGAASASAQGAAGDRGVNGRMASRACTAMSDYKKRLDRLTSRYFSGWRGRVTVEPLRQAPASSAPGH